MSSIIPFNQESNLPAWLQERADSVKELNKDIVTGAVFPSLSIKGKRFAVNRDGVKTVLMKPGVEDEVAQHIGVVVQRANMKSKVFYAKRFTEGESDGQQPDCFSMDGVTPSPNASNPQHKKCALCPHNQFGTAVTDNGEHGKGKACADSARLAVSTPDRLDDPMLLRVPPASLKNLREAVKIINQRKIPYNSVLMKIGFDHEAASPKLTFRPVGLLSEADYTEIAENHYDSELVRAIVGVDEDAAAEPKAPESEVDELDAALAAREATNKAKAAAEAPAPAPKPAAKTAAKAAPATAKPKPVTDDDLADLVPQAAAPAPAPAPKPAPRTSSPVQVDMSDIDSLLGNPDD